MPNIGAELLDLLQALSRMHTLEIIHKVNIRGGSSDRFLAAPLRAEFLRRNPLVFHNIVNLKLNLYAKRYHMGIFHIARACPNVKRASLAVSTFPNRTPGLRQTARLFNLLKVLELEKPNGAWTSRDIARK